MPTVLKLQCEDETLRFLLGEGTITYHKLKEAIEVLKPDINADQAKYLDEEGDLCTVCEQTFHDFITMAEDKVYGSPLHSYQILKLQIQPKAITTLKLSTTDGTVLPATVFAPPPRGVTGTPKHFYIASEAGCSDTEDAMDICDYTTEAEANKKHKYDPAAITEAEDAAQKHELATATRRCAGGCGFLATWHLTHCCHACALGGKHGPKCEQKSILEDANEKPVDPLVISLSSLFPFGAKAEVEKKTEVQADAKAKECPGGCGFLVTWHPTHCCQGCASGHHHGPKCQRSTRRCAAGLNTFGAAFPGTWTSASLKPGWGWSPWEAKQPLKLDAHGCGSVVTPGGDIQSLDFKFTAEPTCTLTCKPHHRKGNMDSVVGKWLILPSGELELQFQAASWVPPVCWRFSK